MSWAEAEIAKGRTYADLAEQLQVHPTSLSRNIQERKQVSPTYACRYCSFRCSDPNGHPQCQEAA